MSRIASITSITAGVLLSALVARDAAAQWNVARFGAERNRAYATFGLDPAVAGAVGYARVVPVAGHHVQVAGEVGAPTAGLDAHDFRARLGAQTSLARWRSVHVTGSATAIARGTENSVYRGFNWGADLTGAVGVYRPRWFAAGEYGKDKAVVTHLTHTDWYRRHVYADARDGWYLDAGGTVHYGFAGGVALGRTEVAGRLGWLRTEDRNTMMPPAYASVAVGVGF